MSLKEIVEPIYTQINNRSARITNVVIKGIDDAAVAGTKTLGAGGNLLSFKIGDSAGANTALDVVSSVATDTRDTGNGARTVRVSGFFYDSSDSNFRKARNCVFKMNGTTIVNTGSGIVSGTNLFCAVTKIEVVSAGSSNCNDGIITAKATGTSTVFNVLQATHYTSKSMLYVTGSKEQLLLKQIHISSAMATAATVEIFEQDIDNGLKILIDKLFVGNNHSDITRPLNHKVGNQKALYATITNLESVIGVNHISANISAVSI